MEGIPQQESRDGKVEKEKAFGDASYIIAVWGNEFKEQYAERGEKVEHVADVMYEFSKFITERSSTMLEYARTENDYRTEQAVAKLHEFNLVHADLLKRSAEVFLHYPDTVPTLAQTYPWILTIQSWAESFVDETQTKSE